ncbi:rhombosortase [Vibrio astriarenae]|uniref:rhombosortase n=1 Tax=Vibrio astriarenae TaxID=1481923 RepID=UPI0037361958
MRHTLKPYFIVALVSVIAIALQFQDPQSYAIWSRQYILDGQWWRIITGHFTHTNVYHMLMNLAAFWVMTFVFKPQSGSLSILIILASTSIGLLNFFTPVQEYAGLSSVLHSVFAYYALKEALSGYRSSWLLVIGIVVKVVWEQAYGASESTTQLIEATVAVDAHMFGVIVGLLFALCGYKKEG